MPRIAIPKSLRDSVLAEYSHKCAMCASERPHLHHIDEDNSNNIASNLLPLCPNCHLRDQHNPTKALDVDKLMLFRKFKDPTILSSQFHPVFSRQRFLSSMEINGQDTGQIESDCDELIEFVATFEMGSFYAKKLRELMQPNQSASIFQIWGDNTPETKQKLEAVNLAYREGLSTARAHIQALLIEQLRYQAWAK